MCSRTFNLGPAATALAAVFAALVLTRASAAQGPPDYGIQWATVTHPGNRPATQAEAPQFFPPYWKSPIIKGRVDYHYRLSVTEVTVEQWFEFVQAYAPYISGNRNDSAFTSPFIRLTQSDPNGPATYEMHPGFGQVPATMSWYYAARFTNWLHSGKATNREAFESGVYDSSTFQRGPDGAWLRPSERAAGARFWIPTADEWIKGAFYDPDRYGLGLDGYWLRPNQGNAPLIPGLPQDGGQTLHGAPESLFGYYPVGLFPSVRSPWGLLDLSGGVTEWLGESGSFSNFVFAKGSSNFGMMLPDSDRLDLFGGTGANFSNFGLRLASVIPSPQFTGVWAAYAFSHFTRRTRRR